MEPALPKSAGRPKPGNKRCRWWRACLFVYSTVAEGNLCRRLIISLFRFLATKGVYGMGSEKKKDAVFQFFTKAHFCFGVCDWPNPNRRSAAEVICFDRNYLDISAGGGIIICSGANTWAKHTHHLHAIVDCASTRAQHQDTTSTFPRSHPIKIGKYGAAPYIYILWQFA